MPQPNIVFVLCDDLGVNDLHCYGRPDHHTPHLDLLASQGTRFTCAYACQAICSASRAGLLTGINPARLHLTTFLNGRPNAPSQRLLHPEIMLYVPLSVKALPRYFKELGYATGFIGKWHIGKKYGPKAHGFDYVYHPGDAKNTLPSDTEGGKAEYELTRETIRFIEEHRHRPFLAYLGHYTPHIPYTAHPRLVEKNRNAFEPVYAALIETLDATIGLLLAKLDELGLAENTIFIFTSDNGGLHVPEGGHVRVTHNTPYRAGKGYVYEGGQRVPLLVRWPGHIPAGRTITEPVSNIDWIPTLLELAGAEPPAGLDGVSFAAALTGRAMPRNRKLFWHFPHYTNQGGRPSGAMRDGDWLLVELYDEQRAELYDLSADVPQKNDVSRQHPQRTAAMLAELDAWRKENNAQYNTPNPDCNEQEFAELYLKFDPSRFDPLTASEAEWARILAWRKGMDKVYRRPQQHHFRMKKIIAAAAAAAAFACVGQAGQAPTPQPEFDLRIELGKPPPQVKLSGWSGGTEWLAPAPQGAKLEVGLEPRDYFLVLTIYDSRAPQHKDDKLAVTANKTRLGEFQRGKAEGWIAWYAAVPESALLGLGPDVPEVFTFTPAGNAPAIKEVRICSALTDEIVKSAPKYVKLDRHGWNINAKRFIHAPVFQVKPMEQAAAYRCSVYGPVDAGTPSKEKEEKIESSRPELDLAPLWNKLPPAGKYDVIINALDSNGGIIGEVVFGFHKSADFHEVKEGYRPAARGYGESGRMAAEYIFRRLAGRAKPLIAQENMYPALFNSFFINLFVAYLGELPAGEERSESVLELAETIAQRMIATSTPSGWAYPHLPISHTSGIPHRAGASNVLQVCRAPMAGLAYLALHKLSQKPELLDAAMKIADTLKATQLPEGRWYFRVNPQTGEVIEDYTSDQAQAILFFDELIGRHGRTDLVGPRDKAVGWMFENPVKTFLWQNQWDDMMAAAPFSNLDWLAAALFGIYLSRHATAENGYLQTARALFRYVEDQFVFWENSFDKSWITPSVAEQYWCFRPIDAHAAHYIRFCLAMHAATKAELFLRKARAMADTLTAVQHPDGYYPTFLDYQKPVKAPGKPDEIGAIEYGGVWLNCTAYSAEALLRLEKYLAEIKSGSAQ